VFNCITIMASSSEETRSFVCLNSPFSGSVKDFNNESSSPDFTLTIPGLNKPLHLHRKCLSGASSAFSRMFEGEEVPCCGCDEEYHRGEWADESGENDRDYIKVLLKMLRFCYGEDQKFNVDEIPIATKVAAQLEFKDLEGLRQRIEDLPKEASHLSSGH